VSLRAVGPRAGEPVGADLDQR